MRPFIALLLTILMFSGVYAYTQFAESVRRPPLEIRPKFAAGIYTVRIDRTFECVGDEDWDDVASLVVKFRGQEILRRTETIPASETILIDPLENVEQRENEIFVSANVSNASATDDWGAESSNEGWEDEASPAEPKAMNHAIRIVVKKGEDLLADKTIWREPGAMTIAGTASFEAPTDDAHADHDH